MPKINSAQQDSKYWEAKDEREYAVRIFNTMYMTDRKKRTDTGISKLPKEVLEEIDKDIADRSIKVVKQIFREITYQNENEKEEDISFGKTEE